MQCILILVAIDID